MPKIKWIPDMLEIWEMGVYDLSKIKYGSFGKIEKSRKKLFIKNLKWLLEKCK